MAKEATLQVRMDAELKDKVEALYRDMGTSFGRGGTNLCKAECSGERDAVCCYGK